MFTPVFIIQYFQFGGFIPYNVLFLIISLVICTITGYWIGMVTWREMLNKYKYYQLQYGIDKIPPIKLSD